MHFDFAAVLTLAAFITGGIWLYDIFVLAPRRPASTPPAKTGDAAAQAIKLPWYVDFSRSFFPIILLVLILRSFIVEPFRIPSGSMEPTLFAGDFILVNKFSFGLRMPVLNWKLIDSGAPQRGDVAVFRYPEDPSVAYIKRVVGLPGDTLEYRSKQLYINGEAVPQTALANSPDGSGYEQRAEHLGAVNHQIQVRTGWNAVDLWPGVAPRRGLDGQLISWSYQVPAGHYFVLGDNRDNSRDSRFWGPLPEGNLIGKAFLIWMNLDCISFKGHCNRIGRSIE